MHNTGDSSATMAAQILVMIVCPDDADDGDDGYIWMPVTALCHFCPEVWRRKERERESMCQSYTHTVEPQQRHTDLSVSKNGKHSYCC